jgi:hypothetical protein
MKLNEFLRVLNEDVECWVNDGSGYACERDGIASAWSEALEMEVSAIWEETVQGVSVMNVEVK